MHNMGKNEWLNFEKKQQKKIFWALFTQIWANENFPKKWGSVTFELLCIPNFK